MITVNSISFSNSLRPSQPTTNRLVGNAGDVITVSMIITTDNTLGDILFNFNCVPNNQQIYADSLTGGIFQSAFNSLTNNAQQLYFENGTLSIPIVPKSFDSTTSFVVTATGNPNEHSIVHTFRLAPFLRENELDNNNFTNPNYYSNTGLKYIFKIDSVIDNSLIDSTDDVNLENTLDTVTNTYKIISRGNVSGWGSSLGTGAINYELSYTPNLIDINDTVTTIHTTQIKKNSGAWLTSDLISYRLQAISEISDYNFTQTLLQNTKFDSVTHNVEDAPQNGANGFLLNCFCEINATDNTLLDVSFSIVGNYAEQFSVFFACSSDVLTLEHQNTLSIFGTASQQGDNSQVEFVNYAGFNENFKIGFINWYNQTFIGEGFNHLRAYRKDDNEVFFGVKINAPTLVLPPALIAANLSNAISAGINKSVVTLNTDSFPFTISVGNSIAVQYFRNSWFTDVIVVDFVFISNGNIVGFRGTPTFTGFPLSNNIGNPQFGRIRNITTSSAVLEIGQQRPTEFPTNSNFPNGVSGGNGSFDSEPSLITLKCGFKDLNTNQFLTNETFNFDFATPLPLVFDRGYIRKSDNPKKYIQVNFVGDRYEFRYGFNLGSEFLASDNIVFEVNVTFTDSNNFALTNTIRSPRVEAGQYDVTQNTIAEPQVLANPTPQPKFYIVDGSNTPDFGTEYDGLIAGQNMLLVATFQDNNLNDLQANEADLAGYFAITTPNELKEIERFFFSTYQSEPDTPFEAINGHTAGLVKVTKVDIKTATLSAIINYDRLKLAFPNTNDLCVVSRLDRPQPELFPFFRDISLHFTSSESGNTLITNPAIENWVNQKFFFDGNHVAANFRFKINTTGATTKDDASWALIPYIDVATFEGSAILTGYTVRIECIDLQGNTDVLSLIEYISLIPTAIPFSGTHLRKRQTAMSDFLAFYKSDLTIASVTSLNTNRFQAVRDDAILDANQDLTNFATLNLTTLNSGLALSPQKYAHYFIENTTAIDNITTVTGNFGSLNREVIEYISPAKYDFAPFSTNPSAILNDRINDKFEVEDNAVKNAFDFNAIPVGSYINVDFCIQASNTQGQRFLCLNSNTGTLASEREFSFGIYGAGLFVNLTQVGNTQGFGFLSPVGRVVVDNGVYKGSFSLQKIGNTLVPSTTIANAVSCLNGKAEPMSAVTLGGGSVEPMPSLNGRGTNSLEVGTYVNSAGIKPTDPVFAPRKTQEIGFSISLTPLTPKDMIEYHRGLRGVQSNQYAWKYDALNADPNPAFRRVPNIGTLADVNNFVLAQNHTNSLTTLF